jgi:hypothetical protein
MAKKENILRDCTDATQVAAETLSQIRRTKFGITGLAKVDLNEHGGDLRGILPEVKEDMKHARWIKRKLKASILRECELAAKELYKISDKYEQLVAIDSAEECEKYRNYDHDNDPDYYED